MLGIVGFLNSETELAQILPAQFIAKAKSFLVYLVVGLGAECFGGHRTEISFKT